MSSRSATATASNDASRGSTIPPSLPIFSIAGPPEMTSTIGRIGCALAAAAFLLLAAPAPNASEDVRSPEAAIEAAQKAMKIGRHDLAVTILRPLAESRPADTNVRFLLAFSAIEASRRAETNDAEREALLDEAIAVLRAILVDRPELVRMRLELARAFFYKGEDTLARSHFERVLAGEVPEAVRANVQRFLVQIRARRRWTMYMGMALLPDTNIGSGTDEDVVYVDFLGVELPFDFNPTEEQTTSGVGASLWAGGEYQHPLAPRLRLRAGGDLARREYPGSRFDSTFLSVHAGPRWLVDRRTEASVLASARRHWRGTSIEHDAWGARLEARRRLAPRITANTRASWHHRDYRHSTSLDGPQVDLSLGGTWTITPNLRAHSSLGFAEERPSRQNRRNRSRSLRAGLTVALPRGFNVGSNAQLRWTDYEGLEVPQHRPRDDSSREDRTWSLSLSLLKRDLTVYGFSPQLVVSHEERDSNAQLISYDRTHGELRFVRQF